MQLDFERNPLFASALEKLKFHFKPEKIYLFGSHANGTATSGSDYDLLLVVKNSDKTSTERMREASEVLWGRTASFDVFIYTEDEFNQLKEEFSSVAHTAFTEGVEL